MKVSAAGHGETSRAPLTVAVVILTFDEEANIGPAIESVLGWAEKIFVVDSFSNDQTVDIVLGYRDDGVEVVQHAFENYSAQWNWALSTLPISSAWTLKLDADERATPEFRNEVSEILSDASVGLEGIYFRRRIVFMNKPVRWGGTSGFDRRMWKTGGGSFDGREVNEHLMVSGETARLRSFVDHHDTNTMSAWWDKHNRYSSLEALSLINRGPGAKVPPRLWGQPDERRQWFRRLFFSHPLRFLSCAGMFSYHFFLRLGFLDGSRGFELAFLRSTFFYLIDLKVLEYRRTGRLPTVTWPSRGKPHPALGDSMRSTIDETSGDGESNLEPEEPPSRHSAPRPAASRG